MQGESAYSQTSYKLFHRLTFLCRHKEQGCCAGQMGRVEGVRVRVCVRVGEVHLWEDERMHTCTWRGRAARTCEDERMREPACPRRATQVHVAQVCLRVVAEVRSAQGPQPSR